MRIVGSSKTDYRFHNTYLHQHNPHPLSRCPPSWLSAPPLFCRGYTTGHYRSTVSDTILRQEEEEEELVAVQITLSVHSLSPLMTITMCCFCSSTYCCRISGQQAMDKTFQPGKGIKLWPTSLSSCFVVVSCVTNRTHLQVLTASPTDLSCQRKQAKTDGVDSNPWHWCQWPPWSSNWTNPSTGAVGVTKQKHPVQGFIKNFLRGAKIEYWNIYIFFWGGGGNNPIWSANEPLPSYLILLQ